MFEKKYGQQGAKVRSVGNLDQGGLLAVKFLSRNG